MYKWQIIERCVLLYEIPVYFYYEMHTFSLCVFTAIYEIRIYIYTHTAAITTSKESGREQ